MKTIRLLLAALLVFTLASFAQDLGTAVLSGDVTDLSGALVSGAQVELVNKNTGVERTTETSKGLFVLNDLAPGEYELRVSASGFASSVSRVRLSVGQQLNVKPRLQLREQATTIEVTDAPPALNTVTSVVDGVVDSRQIESLPLNGRNFLELALLMPGNAPAPNFDPTKRSTVLISSVGQLGRGQNVTIDGSDNNDDVVGGMLLNVPQDAVREFQIATNRFSAEVGRSGSSVVNVVTKSGTNQLHGTAAIYERDRILQAEPRSFGQQVGETPPFRRQQYTGSLGGPVVKDKAWWFSSFEYRDQLGGILVGTRDLATQSIRTGFAEAPLTDILGTTRGDWQISRNDSLNLRYSIERFEGTSTSAQDRAFGTAAQRQRANNNFQDFTASWSRVLSPRLINRASFSVNNFINVTRAPGSTPQIDFPSIQDGSSFRVPQQTRQNRLQWSDNLSWALGKHNLKFGGEFQRVDADFDLGVFRQGRIVAVEDFPSLDRNSDGVLDDNDLLFAVTLRSGTPDRALVLPDADNNYVSWYVQDDWRLHRQFTLNLGLRYELDTDVKNVGRYNQINPIVQSFLTGERRPDRLNFAPRIGFNWANSEGDFSLHGGYGIYYDRITLEIQSLERGLDGRALAIEVRAGNAIADPETGQPVFLDQTGHFVPGAPTMANPFSGFVFPGAGAGGINVIANDMQNPMVQQFNLGVQWEFAKNWVLSADGIHNLGTHFIIGVPSGTVFNPVVGGPDVVKVLSSSVNTHYDGLLLSVDHRFSNGFSFHSAYTLSKALNYANDDQIPFSNGPLDPTNLRREYGPTPNDQRHRLVLSGTVDLPYGFQISPILTVASAVPMDILLPDGSSRIPQIQRNAGGRQFKNAAELNRFITQLNANGGVDGEPMPLVDPNAHFADTFSSLDLRLAKAIRFRERASLELIGEAFNLFNTVNVLGISNTNYSGFANVLARDSNDPTSPGFLRSSSFGRPVTTAGGVFGSGGARAFQLAARFSF